MRNQSSLHKVGLGLILFPLHSGRWRKLCVQDWEKELDVCVWTWAEAGNTLSLCRVFLWSKQFLTLCQSKFVCKGKSTETKGKKKKKANKHSTKQMTLKLYSEQNNYVSVWSCPNCRYLQYHLSCDPRQNVSSAK